MALLRSRALAVTLAAIFSAIAGPMLTFFVGTIPHSNSISRETFLISLVALYVGWPFGTVAGVVFAYALSSKSLLARGGPAYWLSLAAAGALVGALTGPYIWAIDRATSPTQYFNYGALSCMGVFGGMCCALAAASIVRTLLWKKPSSAER